MSFRLKRAVLASATAVWSAAARAAGLCASGRPDLWHSPGGQRVLVVAPHPDDEIACAGTLLLHRRAGDVLHVAHATDGCAARAGGLTRGEMHDRRREEARVAADLLGVAGAHWLGLREGDWEEAALVPALRDLVRQTAPHVLYAPSRVDFHPEHVRVARGLAAALSGDGALGCTIRVYEVQVPLTPVLVNFVTPIGAVVDELIGAMECYPTQLGSIERLLRMKRYAASFYGLSQLAEEFWQMDPAAYRRAHAARAAPEADGAFRGVRARPFTDPLSYLRGLGARQQLRDVSQGP